MPLAYRYFWNWQDALRALTRLVGAGFQPPQVRLFVRPAANWLRPSARGLALIGAAGTLLCSGLGVLLLNAPQGAVTRLSYSDEAALFALIGALVGLMLLSWALQLIRLAAGRRSSLSNRRPRFVIVVRTRGPQLDAAWQILEQGRRPSTWPLAGRPRDSWTEAALVKDGADVDLALRRLWRRGYREEINYEAILSSSRPARARLVQQA